MLAVKHLAILLAGFSLVAHGAETAPKKAAQPKPAQPDIKFLEYLGTVEGDDEDWTDVRTELAVATESQSKGNAKAAKPVMERK